jgi:competence protein ComEC
LLVSPEPLHVRCTPERPFVDRFTVWREGAQAVWLKPEGVVIVSDKQWRGERAWVLGPLTAKQTPAGSVPAPVENLD